MPSVYAHFGVHGVSIAVEADGPALLEPVQAALGAYTSQPGGGAFDLRVRYAQQLPAVAELPEFWRGTLPGGSRIIFRCDPRRRQIEVIDQALADVDLSGGRAEFVVRPGAEACLLEACVLPWLCEILNDHGHYIIHAASLFVNRQPQRKAVLISGPSGSGKTTAGLGLAGQGFGLLADDMTFFSPSAPPEGGQLWGIRLRCCKVHWQTIQMLPWLTDLPRVGGCGNKEVAVDVRQAIAPTVGVTALPGLILFLNPRNPWRHQMHPLDKTRALARLVNENVRAYEKHRDGSAGRAFAAMAELVRTSDTFEVSLCPKLQELGALVKSLLR
jgi:hypothetical protein